MINKKLKTKTLNEFFSENTKNFRKLANKRLSSCLIKLTKEISKSILICQALQFFINHNSIPFWVSKFEISTDRNFYNLHDFQILTYIHLRKKTSSLSRPSTSLN